MKRAALLSVSISRRDQWGRRLEVWPNTTSRLAGWWRVTQHGVILYVMDSLCHLRWRTMPPAPVWVFSADHLAIPADSILLNVQKHCHFSSNKYTVYTASLGGTTSSRERIRCLAQITSCTVYCVYILFTRNKLYNEPIFTSFKRNVLFVVCIFYLHVINCVTNLYLLLLNGMYCSLSVYFVYTLKIV